MGLGSDTDVRVIVRGAGVPGPSRPGMYAGEEVLNRGFDRLYQVPLGGGGRHSPMMP